MKTMHIMAGRFAIYDCPAALKKFLVARESGAATQETLTQLSAAAMREQEEALAKRRPKADLIDFDKARFERGQQG